MKRVLKGYQGQSFQPARIRTLQIPEDQQLPNCRYSGTIPSGVRNSQWRLGRRKRTQRGKHAVLPSVLHFISDGYMSEGKSGSLHLRVRKGKEESNKRAVYRTDRISRRGQTVNSFDASPQSAPATCPCVQYCRVVPSTKTPLLSALLAKKTLFLMF